MIFHFLNTFNGISEPRSLTHKCVIFLSQFVKCVILVVYCNCWWHPKIICSWMQFDRKDVGLIPWIILFGRAYLLVLLKLQNALPWRNLFTWRTICNLRPCGWMEQIRVWANSWAHLNGSLIVGHAVHSLANYRSLQFSCQLPQEFDSRCRISLVHIFFLSLAILVFSQTFFQHSLSCLERWY